MPSPRAVDSSMTPIVRQLLKQVAGSTLRAAWSFVLLGLLAAIGYWAGQFVGAQQGLGWLKWVGVGLGVVTWVLVRPKLKRRSFRGSSSSGQTIVYHDERQIDDGSWFGGDDDSSDSGNGDD